MATKLPCAWIVHSRALLGKSPLLSPPGQGQRYAENRTSIGQRVIRQSGGDHRTGPFESCRSDPGVLYGGHPLQTFTREPLSQTTLLLVLHRYSPTGSLAANSNGA